MSKRMKWAGKVTRMGENRNVHRLLVGKPQGKIPLGKPRRRLVDNVRLDFGDMGWNGMDWIELAQDRDQWMILVNTIMNVWVHKILGGS
jgi:hypothetical protein